MKASKSYTSRYQRDKIRNYLANEAIIIDVRSKNEWKSGHIEGAFHIEMASVPYQINMIKAQDKPVIAVCVSGVRSGEIVQYLLAQGIDAVNGGSWQNVQELMQEE